MEACSWSDLPHLVLDSIIYHLTTFDFLAFGRVCNAWRLVFKSAKHSHLSWQPPFLILPNSQEDDCFLDLRTLPNLQCRRMGWLHCHAGQKLFVVSHGRIIFKEVKKRYPCLSVFDLHSQALFFLPRAPTVVLEGVFIPPSPHAPDGVLLISEGENWAQISLCALSAGRMEWTTQLLGVNLVGSKVVSDDGRRVFAVTGYLDVVVLDVVLFPRPELVLTEILPFPPEIEDRYPTVFLAEADGELFMFDSVCPQEACRLDPSTKNWEELSSLGGRSLFLSHNQCLVRHGPTGWGCETDCIYFVEDATQAVFQYRPRVRRLECLKPGQVPAGRHPQLPPSWVLPLSY